MKNVYCDKDLYLFIDFILSTFNLPSMSSQVIISQARMVPNVTGIIVKPIDFC